MVNLSSLAIALLNKVAKVGKKTRNKYVKRTQRDYSMPFKMAVTYKKSTHNGAGSIVC